MRTTPSNSTPLWISLVAIGMAAIVLVGLLRTVLGAATTGSSGVDDVSARLDAVLTRHEALQEKHQARFDGRSVFFKPILPRIERAPVVREPVQPRPEVDEDPAPPPPPPPPRTYQGPGVVGFDPSFVYFDNGLRIRIGQEAEGIEVRGVNPPWHAQLAYRGWEGEVPIFTRDWEEKILQGTEAFEAVKSGSGSPVGASRFRSDRTRGRPVRGGPPE